MTDNTQPEALRLALSIDLMDTFTNYQQEELDKAAAELRRQHARIAELESQLEAVGAGGVSGPLMGQPQAMPDLTALTERGAKAWTAVDAQALREGRWYMVTHDGVATLCEDRRDAEKEAKDADMAWPHSGPHRAVQLVEASTAGFTAADMATASAQGFRDGVASLSASAPAPSEHIKEPYTLAEVKAKIASNDYSAEMLLQHAMLLLDSAPLSANAGEPAAYLIDWPDEPELEHYFSESPTETGRCRPLYLAAPPTAQAEGWTRLPGQLPEPGMPVLLDIGKKYPIRAMWAAKHTVQAADDDTDWGEYVEADDMYYAPEGWYEWNQCEDNHWRVTETPRAWMPLPPPPTSAEGVEHG